MQDDLMHELFGSALVRIALVGLFAILALFLLAETASVAQDFGRPSNPATDTITVSADGQATLPPDVANVTFSVQNTAALVSDAQAATTKQANAAIDFSKGQGIADKDIRTLSYDITPQYSYGKCPPNVACPIGSPTVTGYPVSETIQLTIHDLTPVGAVLEGLGKLEVQNVSGPSFALADSSAGYDAARADAIAKARAQATLLANQLGVDLGKIVNFSESSNMPYPVMAYGLGGADSAAKAPTPNVPTGQNTYTAHVSVTYEIR